MSAPAPVTPAKPIVGRVTTATVGRVRQSGSWVQPRIGQIQVGRVRQQQEA